LPIFSNVLSIHFYILSNLQNSQIALNWQLILTPVGTGRIQYQAVMQYVVMLNFCFSGLVFFIECQSGTGWQALFANFGSCLVCGVCGMCLTAKGWKVLAQYLVLFYQL